MYTWDGKYPTGSLREHRALKREEAEARNALTPPERKRATARAAGYPRHSAWPTKNGIKV